MDKLIHRVTSLLEHLATVLFISLFLVIVLNIVLRNVFGENWLWIPGISRLLFIWIIFIGTAVLYERHDHLVMDFFVSKMKGSSRTRLELVINLILLAFFVLLIIYGFKVTMVRVGIPFETWNLSTAYAYVAAPVSGILMLIFCLNKLRYLVKGEWYEH
ncbi:MAG: TRAP transporter small permease [Spirochaetota bacterium]